jgi:hypothetical protein
MLLIFLFSQSALVQLLLLSAFGVVCFVLALSFLKLFRTLHPRLDGALPVPTFLGTVATAWALALGFAAADVWTARGHAEQSAAEERSAISRLAGMAQPAALDMPDVIVALRDYNAAVRDVEWGGSLNRDPADEVDEAIQRIRLGIVAEANTSEAAPLLIKLTQDFDELQDARNKRIAIGSNSVSQYKWHLVLFLTFLSTITIVAVHADKPIAARNTMLIFLSAAIVSLWILSLHAVPYSGPAALTFKDIHFQIVSATN